MARKPSPVVSTSVPPKRSRSTRTGDCGRPAAAARRGLTHAERRAKFPRVRARLATSCGEERRLSPRMHDDRKPEDRQECEARREGRRALIVVGLGARHKLRKMLPPAAEAPMPLVPILAVCGWLRRHLRPRTRWFEQAPAALPNAIDVNRVAGGCQAATSPPITLGMAAAVARMIGNSRSGITLAVACAPTKQDSCSQRRIRPCDLRRRLSPLEGQFVSSIRERILLRP